jgi:CHAT domain-containing protein
MAPALTANRTAFSRAARLAIVLVAGYFLACAGKSPRAAYEPLAAAYRKGEFAQVAAAAKARLASSTVDPHASWQWDFRLLEAEALTALSRFSEAGALLAEEPSAELEMQRVRAWLDRAQLKIYLHEDPSALLAQARRVNRNSELAIRLELIEGNMAADRRHPDQAQQFYAAALALAEREKNGYYAANALNNLSVMRRRLNRYEDSIDFGRRAVAAAEAAGALRIAAAAHGSLGTSYAYLGDFTAALEHEQQAVRGLDAVGDRSGATTATGELGLIYDRAGRHQEAIPQHQRAFTRATELGLGRDAARFAQNLAESLLNSGQWDSAHEWNERAWTLAEQTHADATLPFLLRNRAEIARQRGRPDEAAAICRAQLRTNADQRNIVWEAHHLLARIHRDARRYPQAGQEFEAALRDIEATRSDVLDPRYRVTLLSRLMVFYRDYVDSLMDQGATLKALGVAESSRARVLAERLGREVKPAQFTNEAVLRGFAKTSGVSLVAFWVAPSRSFAWVVTPTGVRRFDLPPAAEIETLVTAYRNVVEHSVTDPMEDPAGRALWDKLLAGIAREIPAGSRVVVVPDGPVHRLNLETLVVPGLRPHYWIEDVELAVSPSISLAMSKGAPQRAEGSLLLIGAPDYSGGSYQPLPGAAAEVAELRKRYATVAPAVFTGKDASPAAYRAAGPGRYSVIHFAAHAEANSEKPLESAVVLSRAGDSFKLYASEVVDIPIHADLVTLSGCRGAGVRAYAGEGLMGFAWAFLHAGARAVVAGLWDVSDGVTAPLMANFYDGVLARKTPAAALREAKLRLLREGKYRKAFYWGAFQTYIGGL